MSATNQTLPKLALIPSQETIQDDADAIREALDWLDNNASNRAREALLARLAILRRDYGVDA